ncbi:Cys-tRNA(Pro) deacylase [Acetobacter fallax]|uniref:Cys-tRNA(Pro)/Cys-tRNA(Cys) deacylase n=1 Tax=Acetobacter fallax TaxID=1737473 RepID=A0ABX0KC99_9PROT|nr:Cys-tRNA(Pro) deacylase [Acetobacter fallax]NHO32681.1 Cys-tRNA(Pro) deacylase [Acetobacter fallax]NHO36259.1 Cys-tRNA(Pro) deacylase [Acetobacter fallax]
MTKTTPATAFLKRKNIAFETLVYDYDPSVEKLGVHAAAAVGEPPERVFKTLMAEVDGKPVCVVIPVARELSMKKLAAAFSGKSAKMMKPADAERITGYRVGGISPFGRRKHVPTAVAQEALELSCILMNGGGRGVQVKLAVSDALAAMDGVIADLLASAD